MEKVLITGATGLLGTAISKKLTENGYEALILSRKLNSNNNSFKWNVEIGEIDDRALQHANYIIHLTGAGIAEERWTKYRKVEILESRVKSTRLLYEAIKRTKASVKAFISASAVGYYGSITSDHIFVENDPPANDFLGKVCKTWEDSVDEINSLGIRTVKFRLGVVLSKDGGALPKMLFLFNNYLGAILGNGKQYIPWVHIEDVASAFLFALKNTELKGTYNLVAPDFGKTNRDFSIILSKVLAKPIFLPPVPEFLLKIFLGEMSDLVLKGSPVSSEKLSKTGFRFQYTDLETTLKSVIGK